jgi:multiple sugar transport system permease protein
VIRSGSRRVRVYLAIGVNLHLFGALLLSGFFTRRNWRVRSLLLVYMLPWAVPAIPTFIAIHWMLNGE